MVYHSAALDTTFFALSDPTRRDILSRLSRSDHTISDLASKFDMSLPAVSKHVRVLQRAGLATVERQGRVRRAALSAAPMRGALEWIEHYRRFWESELDLLAVYLAGNTGVIPFTSVGGSMSNTAPTASPPSIEVRRTIRAPRQRVFDAWTKAEEVKAWHAPGPLTVTLAEIDLRPGGAYRIHMAEPSGKEHRASGVYLEVDPPKKVVYTWGWDGDHPVKNSTVTLEFLERGDATEVVLTHAGINDDKERVDHLSGWTQIMDKLEARYSGAAS